MTDRRLYAEDTVTVLNEDPADTTALFVDGSYGDVALAPTLTGAGFLLVSGTGAVSLARVIAGDGLVTISGDGALTLALALAGAGSVAGDVPEPQPTFGAMPYRPRVQPPVKRKRRVVVVQGSARVSLTSSIRATGYVNDYNRTLEVLELLAA